MNVRPYLYILFWTLLLGGIILLIGLHVDPIMSTSRSAVDNTYIQLLIIGLSLGVCGAAGVLYTYKVGKRTSQHYKQDSCTKVVNLRSIAGMSTVAIGGSLIMVAQFLKPEDPKNINSVPSHGDNWGEPSVWLSFIGIAICLSAILFYKKEKGSGVDLTD